MLLGVLGFNVEDCLVGEIVITVHRVYPVLYLAKIIHDGMLHTWRVLDIEVKFWQEQHPPGQFPCSRLFGDEVEEVHVVHVKCELFA